MKISIITPMYNDSDSVIETLESVASQNFENWEQIIIDDGSTDSSLITVKNFIADSQHRERYKVFSQENSDQLKAIYNHLEHITGDLVYILHSDDLLNNNDVLRDASNFMEKNKDIDAIISNLMIIDGDGKDIGIQKIREYRQSRYELVRQLLNLGRHQYVDVAFSRKQVFLGSIASSYLTWNMPFWIVQNNKKVSMLNATNVDFPFVKYRVHSDNYINNDIGAFNVINGELRTAITLMEEYNIPMYKVQNILLRLFNKLRINYPIFYQRRKTKNYLSVIDAIISSRYDISTCDNLYLVSLRGFYSNAKERTIEITESLDLEVFVGNDIRTFSTQLFNDTLSDFYRGMLEDMKLGFNRIICTQDNEEQLKKILNFLNILDSVELVWK